MMFRAALWYARRGWRVFPLYHPLGPEQCACGKRCSNIGKHPRCENGLNDATTDEAQVTAWWSRWPDASIGLRTGDGMGVLDVDPDKGGDETLSALERQHGALPETVECLTGGGGRHLFFNVPRPFRSTVSRLGPGLDTRGDGGYVVAAPSMHRSGRRYTYDAARRPVDVPIADAPAWLVELLNATRERPPAAAPTDPTAVIPDGERNRSMASIAGKLRRIGMSEAAILAALLVTNRERCRPPLDEDEIHKIAASVGRYTPKYDAAQLRNMWEASCPV